MSGNSNGSLAEAIQQEMSQSINQTGQQVVSRSLSIQPTITIRPGFPVRVMVRHDLVLKSYRA
jgi:type IV secretion system protein TrbI